MKTPRWWNSIWIKLGNILFATPWRLNHRVHDWELAKIFMTIVAGSDSTLHIDAQTLGIYGFGHFKIIPFLVLLGINVLFM